MKRNSRKGYLRSNTSEIDEEMQTTDQDSGSGSEQEDDDDVFWY